MCSPWSTPRPLPQEIYFNSMVSSTWSHQKWAILKPLPACHHKHAKPEDIWQLCLRQRTLYEYVFSVLCIDLMSVIFNVHFVSISRIQSLWKFKSRWFSSNYCCSPLNSNTSPLVVGWLKMRNFEINFVNCKYLRWENKYPDHVIMTNNDLRLF